MFTRSVAVARGHGARVVPAWCASLHGSSSSLAPGDMPLSIKQRQQRVVPTSTQAPVRGDIFQCSSFFSSRLSQRVEPDTVQPHGTVGVQQLVPARKHVGGYYSSDVWQCSLLISPSPSSASSFFT